MKRETIYRGDTPSWVFNIKKPDRTAMDLSGWTATFSAESHNTGVQLFSKNAPIQDAANGVLAVSNTEAETAETGEFIAEIELVRTNPSRRVTCEQFLLIIADDVLK